MSNKSTSAGSNPTSFVTDKVVIIARRVREDGSFEEIAVGSMNAETYREELKSVEMGAVDPATLLPEDRTPEEIAADKKSSSKKWYQGWFVKGSDSRRWGLVTLMVFAIYVFLRLLQVVILKASAPAPVEVATASKVGEAVSAWAVAAWSFVRTNAVKFGTFVMSLFKGKKDAVVPMPSDVPSAA